MNKKKPTEYPDEVVHLIESLVLAQDRNSTESNDVQRFAISLLRQWDNDRFDARFNTNEISL